MKINKILHSDVELKFAGSWIWAGSELAPDTYARFRTTIDLTKPPENVEITIAGACGEYELWVNGTHAGRGWTPSTPQVCYADTHPIGEFLQPGKNVIAVLAHGYGTGGQWWSFNPSGIIADVKAGKHIINSSGPDWKASLAPEFQRGAHRLLEILAFAEVVDLRKQERTWMQPEYDDSFWPSANLCTEFDGSVSIPRETELPMTTVHPASPERGGRWLCPEGVQTIDLREAMAEHGQGKYRITSYVMSPGVDAKVAAIGTGDFIVSVNNQELLHHHFRFTLGQRYTEQKYFHLYDMADFGGYEKPVRLEPGWNEVSIDIDATEENWHVSLAFFGGYMPNLMPMVFSAVQKIDVPGWKIEKTGGGAAAATGKPHLRPADALASWAASIPSQKAIPDKDVTIEPGHYAIFDLGRVMSGRPAIDVTAPAGAVLDLQYAEAFAAADQVLHAAGLKYVDRVTCRVGRQKHATLSRRGLRYVKVFNRGGGPAVMHDLSLKVEKVVGDPEGEFECSDDLLNKIFKTSVNTLDVSLNYHLVDCPTRENGQYPGDNYVEVLQMFYLYDDLRLSSKGIRQFPRVQEDSGYIPGMAPAEWRHSLTDYSLIWVSWLMEHYRHTADLGLVKDMLPYIDKLFGYFDSISDAEHSLPQRTSEERFNVFLDHSPIDTRGIPCGYAAWYGKALDDAAYLAKEAGKKNEAKRWAEKAAAVRQAARALFWDEELGLYRDAFADGKLSPSITFQTNVIALYTELATGEQFRTMPEKMWRPDGSKYQPELTLMNPYFQHYVIESLAHTGHFDLALKHIRDYWGLMLSTGATTNYELFQQDSPSLVKDSLCHPWSGSPAYWLPAYVLGVKPVAPGWKKIIAQPRAIKGIDWARGQIPTPHGPINIEWQRKGDKIEVACDTPDGIELLRS